MFIGTTFGLIISVVAALAVINTFRAPAGLRLDAVFNMRLLRCTLVVAHFRLLESFMTIVGLVRVGMCVIVRSDVRMSALIRRRRMGCFDSRHHLIRLRSGLDRRGITDDVGTTMVRPLLRIDARTVVFIRSILWDRRLLTPDAGFICLFRRVSVGRSSRPSTNFSVSAFGNFVPASNLGTAIVRPLRERVCRRAG
ncbi:hypothetical protein CKO32_00560 [Afifella marina DSM 2698]|nr:hypothetical protein [Afifella marina DSM 2698]MBK1627842.1 hypothetical protein [Afifella marina]MBK5916809.1 hypothetical protein [Afifella marina]